MILSLLVPSFVRAQTAIDPAFDPGFLISDAAFGDTQTFGGAEGVQQFLQAKGSVLANTTSEFLAKLREPSDTSWKSRLDDPRSNLGRTRTAAELIYDAATSAGLNPQVLVVTLQKEQTLITKSFTTDSDLQRALDRALGYGCPDNQPCQASFLGFYNQLFGTFDAEGNRWIGAAKSLSRSFAYETSGTRTGRGPLIDASNQAFGSGPFVRPSRMGDAVTFSNETANGYQVEARQTVTLKNYATTALYRYTPHVFNGNYNFWKFYQAWFRYPNGTVLSSNGQLWVVDNGLRRTFSSFVAAQRGLNVAGAIVVSPTELSSYQEGTKLVPKDGTLIGDGTGVLYLIEGGVRHKITSFTASQRGLNTANAVTLDTSEVNSYELGSILLPLENTLLKSDADGTVYIMSGGTKRPLSGTIFAQRKLSFARVATLPAAEVAEIPTGSLMPPTDGTQISSPSGAIYLVQNGTKRIYSAAIFKQRALSASRSLRLTDDEIRGIPDGLPMPPVDNTLVKTADNPTIYAVWQGTKIPITGTVYRLRQYNKKPVMILSQIEIDALATDPHVLAPKDGTLLKSPNDGTIYLVEKGQIRPLTYQAFVNRRFKFSQVITIPAEEVAVFEPGEVIVK